MSNGEVVASQGWTDLVVTAERGVRAVDALLAGFHEPRASHLAMLEALAGRAHVEATYRAALAAGHLWYEFGDLHLSLQREARADATGRPAPRSARGPRASPALW